MDSNFLTHFSEFCSPHWIAIHVPTARKILAGYPDAKFDDIGSLMVEYCRLLDDAGAVHYADTEQEAINSASRPFLRP